jgi:hypothetical protein
MQVLIDAAVLRQISQFSTGKNAKNSAHAELLVRHRLLEITAGHSFHHGSAILHGPYLFT